MKRKVLLSASILLIVLIVSVTLIVYFPLTATSTSEPFYVGVTFGGDNAADARQLIDKVKSYTNLFILQSGSLQRNITAIDEIGNYTIESGLHFAVYLGVDEAFQSAEWLNAAKQRWGEWFVGVYYNDEPGGKMLDSYIQLSKYDDELQITKLGPGGIEVTSNGTRITYWADGKVDMTVFDNPEPDYNNGTLYVTNENGTTPIYNVPRPVDGDFVHFENGTIIHWQPLQKTIETSYYPNGTITILELELPKTTLYTSQNGSERIAQVEPYSSVLNRSPIKNHDQAADLFITRTKNTMTWLKNQSIPIFTADYALYWWDYQSGYDIVLAELGWNNTATQEIGLVRGAANLHNKNWGTIITWTYTLQPYLTSGDEMYEQMRLSYESGAKYVIIFNYAQDMTGPYGTLQDQHFFALEKFWNEIVQNPNITHGNIKAQTALVLPNNYGWGMRRPNDIIWGLWNADNTSQQIWTNLQNKLEQYGIELDIIYDDPKYLATEKYNQIYYWNQTS